MQGYSALAVISLAELSIDRAGAGSLVFRVRRVSGFDHGCKAPASGRAQSKIHLRQGFGGRALRVQLTLPARLTASEGRRSPLEVRNMRKG